jgi:hypothetical protein
MNQSMTRSEKFKIHIARNPKQPYPAKPTVVLLR